MTVPVSYICADNTDIQLTLQQPFIPKEAPKMCDGNEAITHCQSSSPPPTVVKPVISTGVCICVYTCAEQGLIKGLSVALLLLFSQAAALCLCGGETLWWSPLAVQPLLYSPSHHLSSFPLISFPTHSHPDFLSITSFLPLTSFHPPLPPRHWVEWEQPALSKHKDRSCQQVAMATASLSPSRHVPAR